MKIFELDFLDIEILLRINYGHPLGIDPFGMSHEFIQSFFVNSDDAPKIDDRLYILCRRCYLEKYIDRYDLGYSAYRLSKIGSKFLATQSGWTQSELKNRCYNEISTEDLRRLIVGKRTEQKYLQKMKRKKRFPRDVKIYRYNEDGCPVISDDTDEK